MLLASLGIVLLAGCQQQTQPSPDQIRQDTAKATHEAVQDAKAVGQGVVDGLKKSKTVNINAASADQPRSCRESTMHGRGESSLTGRMTTQTTW